MISRALGAATTDPAGEPAGDPAAPRHERHGFGYGGDYNPEQWPRPVWAEDVRLMGEAGVTFATVGVFAWARLEPVPRRFDFGWLDDLLDLLHANGIAVDLATATASPPAWLAHAYPEILPVAADGRRLSYGSRQSWCPSSPIYRQHSLELVEKLATRYAEHPALTMWHVSNELGCHNAHCYCDVSARAFRGWLEQRYHDLAGLNEAWGTAFWSQHYSAWAEVLPPRESTAQNNPTQLLDFRRFSSEELLGQHVAERALLKRITPDVPVTTNFMVSGHIDALDYWSWAPEQDVVSNDHYLDGRIADPHVELSFCADWTRGMAGGAPWLLMEHSTSAVNWQPRNYPKAPGQMKRNSLQHVARGADGVGFFQWRAARAGAEKYHSAMLPHAGTDSRQWRETVDLGDTLRRLQEVAGSRVEGAVAMVLDYPSMWAVERDSLPTADLRYLDRPLALYRALWDSGVTVDMHQPSHDLTGYPVVFAPTLHLLSTEDAARLTAYVEQGGTLVTTYFSGVVDEADHIYLGGYPGALRDVLGIRVEEFCPLRPDQSVSVDGPLSPEGERDMLSCDTWAEDLTLQGAEAVARYTDGPLAGVPAITRHEHGKGVAWYVATRTSPELTARLLRRILDETGVPLSGLPPGVEVVRRSDAEHRYAFVLNHTDSAVTVPLAGFDLLAQTSTEGTLEVGPGGVACVREEAS